MNTEVIKKFIDECSKYLATGKATEHTFRPAFQKLFDEFGAITAINESKRNENGAPDFVFLDKNNNDIVRGYAEMKDMGVNLNDVEESEQFERYKSYNNIFITNNLEYRFFREGVKYLTLKIGEYDEKLHTIIESPDDYQRLLDELLSFFESTPEPIRSGRRLAEIMGSKARLIRYAVEEILQKKEDEEIQGIYRMMKDTLVSDLTEEKFTDMYAQTLVYGLFVARYNDKSPNTFSRAEARMLIPRTNPFLRKFFDHIAGENFNIDLERAVSELCQVFACSDIRTIVHEHLRPEAEGDSERDPIIHFYEDFLANYNKKLRKSMGAYYTPTPVVRYIIRFVDRILEEDFNMQQGIASSKKTKYFHKNGELYSRQNEIPAVQILDPAVGTATFLNETVKYVYHKNFEDGQQGRWNSYVNENLLSRLNGFEIMMTPYVISHLKLDITLNELGAEIKDRPRVFLTNTLSEGIEKDLPLFQYGGLEDVVAKEAKLAAEVKNDLPVMVVMGNPPYSGVSANETEYANSLIKKYKVEPGGMEKLQERKHWLNDDYVKFIAFSEQMIEKNGAGIMALITNNGYLDNPTFRGMRWHLLQTFDKIYIINLHGNTLKGETSPDGSPDKNVFDIKQGVGIIIAIKKSPGKKLGRVYYSEIYGSRDHKFKLLNSDNIKFIPVKRDEKTCYFMPKNTEGKEEYERGIPLNELMPVNSSGIVTMGDEFIISDKRETIKERIINLADGKYDNEKLEKYNLGKNYASFILLNSKALKYNQDRIIPIAYRPFDKRYTYFDNKVIWRWRKDVMQNMLNKPLDEKLDLFTDRPTDQPTNLGGILQ